MLRKVISIFLFVVTAPVFGQVNLQFIPEIHGRNVDGLLNLRIFTTSGPRTVTLNLAVTEQKQGRILNIKTEAFTLSKGNSTVPSSAIRSAKIQFSGNIVSSSVQQSGYFPEGDYEYCFTINPAQSNATMEGSYEQCFSYELVPSAPLMLTEPYDKDKICEKRPLLSWQPSFPQIPGSAYQLVLVEIKDRQNATEALNYNIPIITQSGLVNPVLLYPPSSKELEAGKKYAWQVSAYKNQTVLNRSEVWEFLVDCKDTLEGEIVEDFGYRDIEDLLNGNYYIARGYLKFAVVNSYSEQALRYSITCLTDPKLKIRRLPGRHLKRGANQVNLDLTGNRAFKDGHSYIMKLVLPNGTTRSLRFIFREL